MRSGWCHVLYPWVLLSATCWSRGADMRSAVQSAVWELLFHSNKHGQSFNTFMGRVGKITAPPQLRCSLIAVHCFPLVVLAPIDGLEQSWLSDALLLSLE